MKVLLVNKFHYKKGGSETYYFTLADALKKQGHEVIFFSMKDEKNVPCEQEEYFVSNKAYNGGIKGKISMVKNIAYSKEAYKKMDALLEKEKPDLAILNLVHRQITCSIIDALKKHNVKIFWTMHDLITVCPNYTMLDNEGNICEKCLGGNFKHCFKNKCIKGSTLMSWLAMHEANVIKKRKWYDDVDLFITPSNFLKNKMEKSGCTKSKIIALANPLPLDTRYELNDKDDNYILYFGRLSKEKGIHRLLKVMKDVDYKLIVLGTGPIKEELEEYVKNENITNVELLGFKQGEELTNYIKNSRCVMIPSICNENFPYSATESLALGKPLIVSNHGGLPELVDGNENGYIFDSEEELKNSINKMISLDEEKYSKMCKHSLAKAIKMFDCETYVKYICKSFKDE